MLPVLPLCPFARRAFRSVGSTMTVARLDQGQRYRPRMAFLKKVRAELLRVTGVSTGGTDRARADGAVRCGAPCRGPRVRISRSSILPGAAPRAPGIVLLGGDSPVPRDMPCGHVEPPAPGLRLVAEGRRVQKSRGESCNFKVIYIIISLAELFGRFSFLSYLFPPSSLTAQSFPRGKLIFSTGLPGSAPCRGQGCPPVHSHPLGCSLLYERVSWPAPASCLLPRFQR